MLPEPSILEGTDVRLCTIETRHLSKLRTWINSEDIRNGLNKILPVTPQAHHEWFQKLVNNKKQISFAAEILSFPPRLIGATFLREIDYYNRRATMLAFIGDLPHRNSGFGRQAVNLTLKYGFDYLNLHRISLLVKTYNKQAIGCYEVCGFQEEGILRDYFYFNGEYHNAYIMSILREEFLFDG